MAGAGKRRSRRGLGTIRRLPSGRFQATHVGPDLGRHSAPFTFDARGRAYYRRGKIVLQSSRMLTTVQPSRRPTSTMCSVVAKVAATLS